MKSQEFKRAMSLAVSEAVLPAYLSTEMSSAIGGCATDTKRRFVTVEQVASMIRGHCFTFGGTWDFTELDELQVVARRFDLVN